MRALNEEGQPIQLELNGWEARIFQHEFDHLTGTLFHDRMKPIELEKVRYHQQQQQQQAEPWLW